MKKILSMAFKLFLITVIAGIVLGVVNSITAAPIAQQALKEANEARKNAFPEAVDFKELKVDIPEEYAIVQNVYTALDANGNDIGITAAVVTKGYSSGLNLTIGIGADGTIKGVIVGSHKETPGLGAKATEPEFQSQYAGKPYGEPLEAVKHAPENDNQIEAITGATVTSRAVTNAVNSVSAFYKEISGGAQ